MRLQKAEPRAEPKADMRRRQVIDAAAECFRREGFHGTSIARISQAAGMSSGHIYHYFDSKETIVEAIVKQEEGDFSELLQLLARDEADGDFLDTLYRLMDDLLNRILDPQRVALMLEIASEAARNPRVAAMLQESDRRLVQQFAALAEARGETAIAAVDDPESRVRLEIFALLLSGLTLRSVYSPAIDRPRIARSIKAVLTILWRPTA
ncbi:TetR/AcrR family transcriptional regulator [Azospirillum sp. YIM B02556]|uniref:TetR/AcrR family transcriptional regulator n=1 Tax=Azospirillum endophyticum TaxID=2800326 RepID=A0ABS1FFI8_9PROT|nr:TetR/AcrR family transcriptional regulator [Azospirillum endophyticum]MBK1841982.1 TetR/AcrR family transcriptional regulator [Azospirillum endophyticum]